MMPQIRFVLLGAASLVSLSSVEPARAQMPAQATPNAGSLEEIVVTARKTQEKLQVAPVSVTALTATRLDALNITTADALNGFVPNLNISKGSGYASAANVTIRGVNQADNVLTNDAPIAMYIDGVYMARQIGDLFDLVDLERVEVLRGPQGTLFGRNTTGGAINLITRQPGADFAIQARVGYASDNELQTRAEIDTGEIGNTGLRALFAFSHHQMDGWVRNTLTPRDDGYGSLDSNAFYFDLHGDVTDDLTFDYRIDYTNMHAQPAADQLTVVSPADGAYFGASPTFGGSPLIVSPNFRSTVTSFDANPPEHDEIYGHSLAVSYDFTDAFRLKSITAYRSLANDGHADQAGQGLLLGPVLNTTTGAVTIQQVHPFITLCPGNTPVFPSNICDHQRQYQISEELQATGIWNELKYVAGLYFFDEKVHEEDPEFLTVVLPVVAVIPPAFQSFYLSNPAIQATGGNIGINAFPVTNYWSESKSFAAYQQTSYTPDFLDDKAEFTFGLRYTFDQKTIRQRDFAADSPTVISNFFNGAKNFHNLSWLLSANYKFTPDIMGYWRIANAYKSGGFSARTHANGYNPEVDTSYEVGLKTEFMDHRVRINADVFYTKYENLQVNFFTQDPVTHAAASVTQNAGAATYKGGELEVNIIPAKNWLIDGSFGYTDPEYQQYLAVINGQQVNLASQAIFNYVSKMTYALGVEYDFDPFTFGNLSIRADYNFASPKTFHPLTQFAPLNEIIKSQNYHNLSAYVLLKDIETDYGTWEAKVYGANLINEYQRYAGIDFEIVSGVSYFGNNSYNRTRVVGAQLTFRFSPASHAETEEGTHDPYVPPVAPAPAPKPHSYLVFFDFDKSNLTPEGQKIVDEAAANAETGHVTRIDVTGHTDTVGSDAYNMRLSKRRAETVAAELEGKGIPAGEIAILAKGKRDPLVPTGDGVKEPQNRRVEIVYSDGTSPSS